MARGARLGGVTSVAVAVLAFGASLPAQTLPPRAAVDTIRGRVIGPDGPSEAALVTVTSVHGGKPQQTLTDEQGNYTVVTPSRVGDYHVLVRALGFRPVTLHVTRTGTDGALTGNVTLTPVQLAPVYAAAQPRPRVSRGRYASPGREVSEAPEPWQDMADPWQNPAQYTVLGIDPADNRITLNGATVQTILPLAGEAAAKAFVTNSSDPSVGGFAGGQVRHDISTLVGNFQTYRLHLSLAPAAWQWTDRTSNAIGARSGTVNGGFDVATPLFGSVRHRSTVSITHTQTPLPQLPRTVAGLARFGLAPDSVDRFAALVSTLGIPGPLASRPSDQATRRVAWVTTLDGGRPDSGTTYSVTLNAGEAASDHVDASPLALTSHDGLSRQRGLVAMGTVQRDIVGSLLMQITGMANRFEERTAPYTTGPEGRVRIGDSVITWMTFGGNSSLGHRTESLAWETKASVQWHSMDARHRFEVGSVLAQQRSRVTSDDHTRGVFEYASLDDLASGRPARFTGIMNAPNRASASTTLAVYAADVWAPWDRWRFQYGLRLDGGRAGPLPAFNAAVDTAFGRRTDFAPRAIAVSPRLGFTRLYGWKGRMVPGVRISSFGVSVGRYQSTLSASDLALAAQSTGLPSSIRMLDCVGAAVPTPQWASYGSDPAAVPTACADGETAQPLASNAPAVRLFDRSYRPTTRWSADLAWNSRQRVWFDARLNYTRYTHPTALDLNLRRVPQFTLPMEGDRPVYSAAGAIVPSTGTAATESARLVPDFGPVLLSRSDLTTTVTTLTLARRFALPRGAGVNAQYRYQWGASESRGFDDVTSGDPFLVGRGPLAWPRHTLVLGTEWERTRIDRDMENVALSVRLTVALQSGQRYTPRVAQDVNGDGRANDAAFIFAPVAAPSMDVADGMTALLQGAPRAARQCLTTQLGGIAGRNSCTGPWSTRADLFIDYLFPGSRGAKLRLDVPNVAGLLDQVLHGQARRGWGDPVVVDPMLLVVNGFDPSTRQFQYSVNRRFGQRQTLIHTPFQLRLAVSIPVGPTEEAQSAKQMARTLRIARDQSRDMFRRFIPYANPFAKLRSMREALDLTADQDTAISSAERAWQLSVDSAGGAFNRYVHEATGTTPDMELFLAYRRTLTEIGALTMKWMQTLRDQFSPRQMAVMDDDLRSQLTGCRRHMLVLNRGRGVVMGC